MKEIVFHEKLLVCILSAFFDFSIFFCDYENFFPRILSWKENEECNKFFHIVRKIHYYLVIKKFSAHIQLRRSLQRTVHLQPLRLHRWFGTRIKSSKSLTKDAAKSFSDCTESKKWKTRFISRRNPFNPRGYWTIKTRHLRKHFLYAWRYLHSRRCVSVLSTWKWIPPLSSTFTNLVVKNWNTLYNFSCFSRRIRRL